MRRHCLDNEIVCLPEAIHDVHRFGIGGDDLVRNAFDEPHLQPAAGDHIDDRHFLRDAQGIVAVRNGGAQSEEPRAPGLARQNGEREVHRGAHAGRRGVVLVDDDVQAEFVRKHPFVEIAIVQAGRRLRIAVPVGKTNPQRFRILEPGVGIGLLAEAVHFHLLALGNHPSRSFPRGVARETNSTILREQVA